VIALTASQSPLARRADVCIAVDHTEDSSSFVAMISRILHLLALDMVAVGVAVRRSPADDASSDGVDAAPRAEQSLPAPGMLISHIG
jgi:glucokinase